MTSLAARFRRLKERNNPAAAGSHKLVIVRDEARPLTKTAKAARLYLAELETAGAVVVRPDSEALVALRALENLLASVKAGDVAHDGQTVTLDKVLDWLRVHLSPTLVELAEDLTAYPGLGDNREWNRRDETINDGQSLGDAIAEILVRDPVVKLADIAIETKTSARVVDETILAQGHRFGRISGDPIVVFAMH